MRIGSAPEMAEPGIEGLESLGLQGKKALRLKAFTANPRKLEHGFRMIRARIPPCNPVLYLKAMRIMMFQLSGYYCRVLRLCFRA